MSESERNESSGSALDGVDTCLAPIERLSVDCLIEIMQRLPDTEIIRNLKLLSRQNPKLKNALFGVAAEQVPKWRISQIKQEIIKAGSQGSNSSRDPSVDDQFEDNVIQNYVMFVRSIYGPIPADIRESYEHWVVFPINPIDLGFS